MGQTWPKANEEFLDVLTIKLNVYIGEPFYLGCTQNYVVKILKFFDLHSPNLFISISHLSPESFAINNWEFSNWKLIWDMQRISVTACSIDKYTFSVPSAIFHVRTEFNFFC